MNRREQQLPPAEQYFQNALDLPIISVLNSEYRENSTELFFTLEQGGKKWEVGELDLLKAISNTNLLTAKDDHVNNFIIELEINGDCKLTFASESENAINDAYTKVKQFYRNIITTVIENDIKNKDAKEYRDSFARFYSKSKIKQSMFDKARIAASKIIPFSIFSNRYVNGISASEYKHFLTQIEDLDHICFLANELIQGLIRSQQTEQSYIEEHPIDTEDSQEITYYRYTQVDWKKEANRDHKVLSAKTELRLPESNHLIIRGSGNYVVRQSNELSPGIMSIEHSYRQSPGTDNPPFERISLVEVGNVQHMELNLGDPHNDVINTVIEVGFDSQKREEQTPLTLDIQTLSGNITLQNLSNVENAILKAPRAIKVTGDIGFKNAEVSASQSIEVSKVSNVKITNENGSPQIVTIEGIHNRVTFESDTWHAGGLYVSIDPAKLQESEDTASKITNYDWKLSGIKEVVFKHKDTFGVLVHGSISFERIDTLIADTTIFKNVVRLFQVSSFNILKAKAAYRKFANGHINNTRYSDDAKRSVPVPSHNFLYYLGQRSVEQADTQARTTFIVNPTVDHVLPRDMTRPIETEVPASSVPRHIPEFRWKQIDDGEQLNDNRKKT